MKVLVVTSRRNSKEYSVELQQGSQFFRLDYSGSKIEARWMAKMFRKALDKHDEEMKQAKPPVKHRSRKAKTTTPEDIDRQFSTLNKAVKGFNEELNKVS